MLTQFNLCGKPTRRGACKMRLSRDGKCPVHDLTDLAARNAKVAQSFREHKPEAFRAQRKCAGRAGFEKVGGLAWWYEQTAKAREWRLQHPSEPESLLGAILESLTLVPYDREYIIDADPRAVDVAFAAWKCCIEVTERADRASFGRNDKREAKRQWLAARGWHVHYFYYDADPQIETQRLTEFLQAHNLIV